MQQTYMQSQIPDFTNTGNLPPGIHRAAWAEFETRFGWNASRKRQLEGLKEAIAALGAAGCMAVYVDGSFVTAKEIPGDYDACWDPRGVDHRLLMRQAPALFDFSNGRARQKALYRGELFLSNFVADDDGRTYIEFFQQDRDSEESKGIIQLDPGDVR